MKYLNKETNGITLSRIGLGAMRMADVQQGVDTIHAALDSGITYLNTGDFYGHGESELVIREALKTRERGDIFIAVKFGGMLTSDDRFYGIDVRPQNVQNYLAYTLKRLGTDYVDLYQPARINPHIPVEDTIGAVADLVKAGYVRSVGITEIDAETLRRRMPFILSVWLKYDIPCWIVTLKRGFYPLHENWVLMWLHSPTSFME